MMMHDRDRDDVFELLQLAEDQRAVRPRAGERNIEVVAARLGLEAAFAPFRRLAVDGHPVAPLGVLAHEFSA
jgi:hypothetical protein